MKIVGRLLWSKLIFLSVFAIIGVIEDCLRKLWRLWGGSMMKICFAFQIFIMRIVSGEQPLPPVTNINFPSVVYVYITIVTMTTEIRFSFRRIDTDVSFNICYD